MKLSSGSWLLLLGGTAAIALVAWAGAASIGREVWRAAWAVPPAILLHATQLLLSAEAWRRATGLTQPHLITWWRIRWIREAVNSMLPVAQLGGNVVGIRLLCAEGLAAPRATAGTVLDVTTEAASQALFTLAGIAVVATVAVGHAWVPLLAGGTTLLLAGTAGFIAAQRLGALKLIEAVAARLVGQTLAGLHDETMRLWRNRLAVLSATALHLVAWAMGTFETSLGLWAMGVPQSLTACFAIESLAMAARSAGFAVPGALGIQETGFVLVGGLFGLPADTAVALSMVKRAREISGGVIGLLAWQWSALRATARPLPRSGLDTTPGDRPMSDLPPILPPEPGYAPPPGPGPDLPPVPDELPGGMPPGELPGDAPIPIVTIL